MTALQRIEAELDVPPQIRVDTRARAHICSGRPGEQSPGRSDQRDRRFVGPRNGVGSGHKSGPAMAIRASRRRVAHARKAES